MNGILVSQTLRALLADGAIQALLPLRPDQVQPSSLDLRLGARVWQLQCSFLPGAEGIERKLGRLATTVQRTDRDDPLVLHRGGVYLAEIEEVLALPEGVWGRSNPKSSTGRLDVFVRLLTETGHAFDTVPAGYAGRLFLEITPQSFHVAVRRGDTLCQLRLARRRPGHDEDAQRARPARAHIHRSSWRFREGAPLAACRASLGRSRLDPVTDQLEPLGAVPRSPLEAGGNALNGPPGVAGVRGTRRDATVRPPPRGTRAVHSLVVARRHRCGLAARLSLRPARAPCIRAAATTFPITASKHGRGCAPMVITVTCMPPNARRTVAPRSAPVVGGAHGSMHALATAEPARRSAAPYICTSVHRTSM